MATLLVQCEGGLLWNRSSSLLTITNFNQIQFIFIVFLVHFFIVAFSNYTIKKNCSLILISEKLSYGNTATIYTLFTSRNELIVVKSLNSNHRFLYVKLN